MEKTKYLVAIGEDTFEVAADDITHCRFCGYQDQYPLRRDIPKV